MELVDVVMKLAGPIDPIGKPEVDAERYGNLEQLLELTDLLLGKIDGIATDNAHRVEASRKRAGALCARFLVDVSD